MASPHLHTGSLVCAWERTHADATPQTAAFAPEVEATEIDRQQSRGSAAISALCSCLVCNGTSLMRHGTNSTNYTPMPLQYIVICHILSL